MKRSFIPVLSVLLSFLMIALLFPADAAAFGFGAPGAPEAVGQGGEAVFCLFPFRSAALQKAKYRGKRYV